MRLDVQDGTFHAEYEGTWYDARTKDELSAKIRQAAQKTIDVEWTRYLVVDYEAKAWPLEGDSGRPKTNGQYDTLSIDEDRATLTRDPQGNKWSKRNCTRVVTSIDLHWHVCEFSTPYALPEDKNKTVRMRREVDCQLDDRDDDGRETYREVVGAPSEQDDDKLPVGAVPWTAEREAFLREVLAALGKLDVRMVELFRGDPDQLARRLDAVAQQDPDRLLAAPAPTPTTHDDATTGQYPDQESVRALLGAAQNLRSSVLRNPSDKTGADYAFPERIVLDKESLAKFSAEMANPGPPNDALRELFKKPRKPRKRT